MRSLDRSLQLLDLLSRDAGGAGVTALADLTGQPPSTVHRLLNALADHRLVTQDETTRRYRLGPGVLTYGEAYLRQSDLVTIGREHLDAIRETTLESVFLTEKSRNGAICVATAESPRS